MSEVKMLKNQVFVLSCRMNDVEVEVKERWFKRRFEKITKNGFSDIDFQIEKGFLSHAEIGLKK